jgi:N-acetylmuramoyl-L-alanine amidase
MWKMYSAMKKFILTSLFIFLLAFPLSAEKMTEVSLRFSRLDNKIRIVLESNEIFILNANTVSSLSNITIEFPSRFELIMHKDFIYETLVKDRYLIINPEDIVNIRVFKLYSPARLVLDLETLQKEQLNTDYPVEKANIADILVIDAGHGGYDYGVVSEDKKEKNVNLEIARELSDVLTKKGRKVFLTRNADQSASIANRIKTSNNKKPDIFISFHSSLSNKFAIYISTIDNLNTDLTLKLYRQSFIQNRHVEKSRELSYSIGDSLISELNLDVVLRKLSLPILNSIDCPAILIEYPSIKFHSYDKEMRVKIINAILRGIESYEL